MSIGPAAGILDASRRRGGSGGGGGILGYNTMGSANITLGVGRLLTSRFTLASAGTLTELHGWFHVGAGGVWSARLVCYAADGSGGNPGTRLAYTTPISLPVGDNEVQQAGFSVALTAANYYIGWYGYSSSAGSASVAGETSGGTHAGIFSGVADPPPNPFGTPDMSGAFKLSCWAVLT